MALAADGRLYVTTDESSVDVARLAAMLERSDPVERGLLRDRLRLIDSEAVISVRAPTRVLNGRTAKGRARRS